MKYFLRPYTEKTSLTNVPDCFMEEYRIQLSNKKSEIDDCAEEWDNIKRVIHPYEYIYHSSHTPKNISCIKPVSRSYFKLVEILQDYEIIVDGIRALCLAEAPGGFVQRLLEKNVSEIHGITLVTQDNRVPYWNYKINHEPRFHTHIGVTKDGDLTNFQNIIEFSRNIKGISLVTGDGGFDVSDDYDSQENKSFPLIFSEVYLGLLVLEKGGVFICKIFDTFQKRTLDLLGILHRCFESVVFHKPCMSRSSNSEKYVVCLGYLGKDVSIMNHMTHVYLANFKGLETDVSAEFIEDMTNFVSKYTTNQIKLIDNGIHEIVSKNPRRKPTQLQIQKACEWCNTYNIQLNPKCMYL